MSKMSDKYNEIEEYGKKGRGRKEIISHLNNSKLTARQSILAKCYECMGYYADGTNDCKMETCPLYPFMPYRSGEKYRTRTSSVSPERMEKIINRLANGRMTKVDK